ncbi:MAG: hypothetical protein ACJ0BB_02070 [Dehalococcoidia bacterium]
MTLEYPNSPILSFEEENEVVVVNPKLSVEEVSDELREISSRTARTWLWSDIRESVEKGFV